MSKEHAYAYEAGYRDGSVHYELEHCPACKNIVDLQEALEENAKLRGLIVRCCECESAREHYEGMDVWWCGFLAMYVGSSDFCCWGKKRENE